MDKYICCAVVENKHDYTSQLSVAKITTIFHVKRHAENFCQIIKDLTPVFFSVGTMDIDDHLLEMLLSPNPPIDVSITPETLEDIVEFKKTNEWKYNSNSRYRELLKSIVMCGKLDGEPRDKFLNHIDDLTDFSDNRVPNITNMIKSWEITRNDIINAVMNSGKLLLELDILLQVPGGSARLCPGFTMASLAEHKEVLDNWKKSTPGNSEISRSEGYRRRMNTVDSLLNRPHMKLYRPIDNADPQLERDVQALLASRHSPDGVDPELLERVKGYSILDSSAAQPFNCDNTIADEYRDDFAGDVLNVFPINVKGTTIEDPRLPLSLIPSDRIERVKEDNLIAQEHFRLARKLKDESTEISVDVPDEVLGELNLTHNLSELQALSAKHHLPEGDSDPVFTNRERMIWKAIYNTWSSENHSHGMIYGCSIHTMISHMDLEYRDGEDDHRRSISPYNIHHTELRTVIGKAIVFGWMKTTINRFNDQRMYCLYHNRKRFRNKENTEWALKRTGHMIDSFEHYGEDERDARYIEHERGYSSIEEYVKLPFDAR